MKLTIVYDNDVYKKGVGLKSNWGFSCLIETKDENILFDTGTKGKILINNMKILDIGPRDINKIVISHEHHDHNGGIESLVPFIENAEIYRLEKTDIDEKIKTMVVEKPQMISEDVYTTGRLAGSPKDEQSLILKGKKGWYVLVGCSHSGVENILQASEKFGDVLGIIGGLHGFKNFPVLGDLDLICASHCTRYKRKLKKLYPTKFVEGGVGQVFDI